MLTNNIIVCRTLSSSKPESVNSHSVFINDIALFFKLSNKKHSYCFGLEIKLFHFITLYRIENFSFDDFLHRREAYLYDFWLFGFTAQYQRFYNVRTWLTHRFKTNNQQLKIPISIYSFFLSVNGELTYSYKRRLRTNYIYIYIQKSV